MMPNAGDQTLRTEKTATGDESLKHAVQLANQGRVEDAAAVVEQALDRSPVSTEAVLLMRQFERLLGDEWRNQRERETLQRLKEASGTSDWEHEVRRTASFENAPAVMRWLREVATFDGLEEQAQPQDPATPPRVSVIIPVFNRGSEARHAFESVVRQTEGGWEVIFVDDGSTDNTAVELESIQKAYPAYRVQIVTLERNRGRPGARNAGVEKASGEFLVMLDSDDSLAPRFLESTLAAAGKNPCAAWIAPITVQYGDVNRIFGFEQYNPRILLSRNQFTITNLLRRDVYERLDGLREEMTGGLEDWDFWIRAVRHGYRPAQVYRPLFFYQRHNEGSISGWFAEDAQRERNAKRQILEGNSELYRTDLPDLDELLAGPQIAPSLIRRDVLNELLARPNPLPSSRGVSGRSTTEFGNRESSGAPPADSSVPSRRARKILFVCHDFPPYRFAGAQLYAFHLAKQLIELGNDVRVLYALNASDAKPKSARAYDLLEDRYENVPVYQLVVDDSAQDMRVHPQHAYSSPRIDSIFRDLLIRERFDAVHFHLLYRLSSGLPSVTKELNIPSFATLHDYWLLCSMGHMIDTRGRECSGPESPGKCAACMTGFNPNVRQEPYVQFQRDRHEKLRRAFDDIDVVTSPSRFLAQIHEQYGMQGARVLPLGWLPLNIDERRPLNPERIVFVFCGQIQYRKGLDVMLDAFEKLSRKNWELRVYGRDYQPEYFKQILARLERHPSMSYRGEFAPEDLPAIYAGADVALIPSRRENYPLTLQEALSAGMPVLASRVGGIPEIVRDGLDGYMFTNEKAGELRAILEDLLGDPEKIRRLHQTVRSPKTIAENALEVQRLYQERQAASKS